MSHLDYKEKLNRLVISLFQNSKDAKNRFIENEDRLKAVVSASIFENEDIIEKWKLIWDNLNSEKPLLSDENEVIETSFHQTVKNKKHKSLEKFLSIIWEEYSRIS